VTYEKSVAIASTCDATIASLRPTNTTFASTADRSGGLLRHSDGETAQLLSSELLIGAVIARRSSDRSFSNYCE
jgi:hypothetical protein